MFTRKGEKPMSVKEKLLQELACAIDAVYGDQAEKDVDENPITSSDIDAVARKTKFYLDLD